MFNVIKLWVFWGIFMSPLCKADGVSHVYISRSGDSRAYNVKDFDKILKKVRKADGEVIHRLSIMYELYLLDAKNYTVSVLYISEDEIENGDFSVNTSRQFTVLSIAKVQRQMVKELYNRLSKAEASLTLEKNSLRIRSNSPPKKNKKELKN